MSADRAMHELQNFNFFGSQMVIEYARSVSDETRRIQHENLQQQIMDGTMPPGSDKG